MREDGRLLYKFVVILGSDEIHPKQILYHVPRYLRGVNKGQNYFQVRPSPNIVIIFAKFR